MNCIFFDDYRIEHFYPLALTRPVVDFRFGILTIREKWHKTLNIETSSNLTRAYLAEKFPIHIANENILINGRVVPSDDLIAEINALSANEKLVKDELVIAAKLSKEALVEWQKKQIDIRLLDVVKVKSQYTVDKLEHIWDVFQLNAAAIKFDFDLITKDRESQKIDDSNNCIGHQVFIEEGAKVSAAILNSETGPIYIGKNAEVMEGSIIRGPFALCDHAVLKIGAKIYGATTVGPYCKVGGEVNNSILFAYSNKGHDGFLGNSILGEWCNLGADTNNSNLKNNYGDVKLWNYSSKNYENTRLQFLGLVMGDHSKSGINTMFNTGTVVGVSANVFGAGFPQKYIPSFTWGGVENSTKFKLNKAFEVAQRMMERRGKNCDHTEQKILEYLFLNNDYQE